MLVQLIRSARFLANALVLDDNPRRLALAVSLGMILGVVPKGNLTAVLILIGVLSLRVNLVAVFCSTIVFSAFGAACAPICDLIGGGLLRASIFKPLWTFFFDMPLVPWTALNHTVVLGSVVLAVYLFYPVYLASFMAIEGLQPWIREKIKRFKIQPLLTSMQLFMRSRKLGRTRKA